jgi:hypothetical protein
VESEEGKGSSFSFTVPFAIDSSPEVGSLVTSTSTNSLGDAGEAAKYPLPDVLVVDGKFKLYTIFLYLSPYISY